MQCCGWAFTGESAGHGSLTFGGYKTGAFSGSLAWAPLKKDPRYGDYTYYTVKMTNPPEEQGATTIVDSGTSALFLTSGPYDDVTRAIHAAARKHNINVDRVLTKELKYLPCIHLELEGGVKLKIPPSTYYPLVTPGRSNDDAADQIDTGLQLMFVGELRTFQISRATGHRPMNILGQTVMEAYYTVFDRGGKRVGFAPIAGCGNQQPSLKCTGKVSW